jgi:SAM-dependent methyltransferase
MSGENYESDWWARVYDQWNERGGRRKTHESEFQFYRSELEGVEGPVLEAACGTGSILLRLAALGYEMWGFDISEAMLGQLQLKVMERGLPEVPARISRQGLVDFRYEKLFAAIIVPASAFLLLPTQEEQIACLKNIRAHLAPGGRLLLNFYIPAFDDLLRHQRAPLVEEEFGEFLHPQTGLAIEVTHKTEVDLGAQTETIYWCFQHDGKKSAVPLRGRWIYKEEFQLLLRLAGFAHWKLYGSPAGKPYSATDGMGSTYWVVERVGP